MQQRILLIRHGRSAHVHRNGWVNAAGIAQWRTEYDEAGITADDMPPPELAREVADAGLLVASDMPRAIDSAERLVPGWPVVVSPLLREMPQDIPTWLPIRMPPLGWHLLITAVWGVQILRGVDGQPQERARAANAANWLARLAREHSTVAVLTHGVFRRAVGEKLAVLGWSAEPRRGGYEHWSVWPFVAPTPTRRRS